jgi:hypothetical protein
MLNEESLKRLSPTNVSSVNDIKYFGPWFHTTPDRHPTVPGSYKFLGIAEKSRSIPYKEFYYTVNNIGFRGTLPSTETEVIGFFGCSFTYGEGVADEDCFSSIVSKTVNMPCLNLGMIGHSAQQIAQIFYAASRIWKIKTAIITLPGPERFHYVTSKNCQWPVFPNTDHNDPEHENVRKVLYKYFSEEHFLHSIKDTVLFIDLISKVYNIKVIWGSWSNSTESVIKSALNITPLFFTYRHPDNIKLEGDWIARDNMHPGIAQHSLYAKKIIKEIKEGIENE